MYLFLYHDGYYALLQIKSLSGHMHMYKMENKLLPSQVMLQKHCLWDTVMINWDNVQILKHDIPVAIRPYHLQYGQMVKALACQVEGPGFESDHGKSFGKSFRKVLVKSFKKKASYPLP